MPTNGALAGCLDRSQDRNAEEVLISTNRDPSSSLCPADTPVLRMQKDCLIMVAAGWGWCRWDGQDRESRNACVTDINLNILATTSPPRWEEKAECWWLYDGWLIQEPSDPMMDHSQTEQVVGHAETVSSGVWGKRRHAEGKHADAVCAY